LEVAKSTIWVSQIRKLGATKNANWDIQKRKVFSKKRYLALEALYEIHLDEHGLMYLKTRQFV
jgi:hypothetical protein